MRGKNVLRNICVASLLEVVTFVCGLITPRLILQSFGSGYNGIITSITQFISIVSLLRGGVGGVSRAALYKPLAEKDNNRISSIVITTDRFMKKIAVIIAVYLVVLSAVYPFIVEGFKWLEISSLVFIIGIGTFVQYYFATSYQILLQADQKLYLCNIFQMFMTLLNTIFVLFLIKCKANIQMVRLGSSVAYSIGPIFTYYYTRRKYRINRDAKIDIKILSQRWDAFAHNISGYINDNTDVMILTILAHDIKLVSVYSVYYMVINGIKKAINTLESGYEAALGNMFAKNEYQQINIAIGILELIVYTSITILFGTTYVLILPFIRIYTMGITDINYIVPIFAYVAIAAEITICIRTPYATVVNAVGHFKQTKKAAITEAIINIVISCIGVKYIGIVGVSIGTFIAQLYRTCYYVVYVQNNLVKRNIKFFLVHISTMVLGIVIIIETANLMFGQIHAESYQQWCLYAIPVFLFAVLVGFIIDIVFWRKDLRQLWAIVKRIKHSNKIICLK